MDNKILLVGTWFGTALTTFVLSLALLIYISSEQTVSLASNTYQIYQALPETQLTISDSIAPTNARAKILEDFFRGYKSELANFANQFVEVADQYQLDYKLMPAIAMQESNGGRRMPKDSYNPFGFGIYGSKILHFDSFDEAIETVGQTLRENYLDQGLETPYEIMTRYTPQSEAKGSPWAIGVISFMEELH